MTSGRGGAQNKGAGGRLGAAAREAGEGQAAREAGATETFGGAAGGCLAPGAPLRAGLAGSLSARAGPASIPRLPPVQMPGSLGAFPAPAPERGAESPALRVSLARDAGRAVWKPANPAARRAPGPTDPSPQNGPSRIRMRAR